MPRDPDVPDGSNRGGGVLNGLDLFSGIGGISLALSPWVRPVVYCENERYAQAVLLSRMRNGELSAAPVWDDVRTLQGDTLGNWIDIVYGGFPCQDISVAGAGKGLDGQRSGLFFEVVRIVEEARPAFVFLENVAAIRTRGLSRVVRELARLGFDLRWTTISAAGVGAPHLRKRWFLLAAHPDRLGVRKLRRWGCRALRKSAAQSIKYGSSKPLADTSSAGREKFNATTEPERQGHNPRGTPTYRGAARWETEPDVGLVAHGIPARVDRIRGLGNAVVPLQAREAFTRLLGIESQRGSA